MKQCKELAKQIRIDSVRMTNHGRSGHVGSMLSMADMIAVLYEKILNVDPKNPKMPDRDRFILSKGHAGAAVYSALAAKGFIPKDWLMTYYCDNGKLMGHISHKVPGVEFSTGSLGHGLPVAVGMAIAARYAKSNRKIICMSSDGDMNEGSTWEAIMFAAQQKLSNLTLVIDYNQVQALGHSEEVIDLRELKPKLENFGFAVKEIDGHNLEEIYEAFSNLPIMNDRPSAIIAHTIKCKGIPALEDTVKSHYGFIPDDEVEAIIKRIEEEE
ncbi:MAG: transketolase [Clostridia bacterium]|nr:transketolase [Clostridia bacterium]